MTFVNERPLILGLAHNLLSSVSLFCLAAYSGCSQQVNRDSNRGHSIGLQTCLVKHTTFLVKLLAG